jgi:hypothetical protein
MTILALVKYTPHNLNLLSPKAYGIYEARVALKPTTIGFVVKPVDTFAIPIPAIIAAEPNLPIIKDNV